ncbi:MOSC domain-containing protein [Elusimicrobiota bacterium]
MTGKILAICTSSKKGVKKQSVKQARLVENHGIEGDAHAGDWHRQVSLLAVESIDKIRAKGLEVGFGSFAENIATQGIDLVSLKIGQGLRIGNEIVLEVAQIGKECHDRCEIFKAVGDCVMPREGVFARVIKGGSVKPGDVIETLDVKA